MTQPDDFIIASYASVGRDRYAWLVCTFSAYSIGAPEHFGYAVGEGTAIIECHRAYDELHASKPLPVLKVKNVARMNMPAGYARAWHSKLAEAKRRERPASSSTAQVPLEFVYRVGGYFDGGNFIPKIIRHQILRKTPKKIVIHRRPYRRGHVWEDTGTIHLDRVKLERGETVFHNWDTWSLTPEAFPAPAASANADVLLLGVTWPCDGRTLLRTFRAKVKLAHPDGGGSDAEFIALRRAYERLKPQAS